LCFLTVGLAIILRREFFPPAYFPEFHTLFPVWPTFDMMGTLTLFIISMVMLILPKFMGLLLLLLSSKKTKLFAGYIGITVSVFIEIFFSALIAPIMMLFQSKFVFDIFSGRDVGWGNQNRGDDSTSWKDAAIRHIWHV